MSRPLPPLPETTNFDDLSELLKLMLSEKTAALFSKADATYIPWEKFRYLPMPDGVDPAKAWRALKVSRGMKLKSIPLRDPHGRPFKFMLPDAVLETLRDVDLHAGGHLATPSDEGELRHDIDQNHVILNSLMDEAISTAQIEGAVTTVQVAKQMLRSSRSPKNKSERMIANSYKTIRLLSERLDRPLSIELLLEIQESMTEGTLKDPSLAGRLRTDADQTTIVDTSNGEVVFVPPPAKSLPERLKKLIKFANTPSKGETFIHPLVKAAILHFWIAYDHPFPDGNGRTARALFYWFMLKHEYWLFKYLTISNEIKDAQGQYYRSFLHTEQDENDTTYSLLYMINATKKAIAKLHATLAQKQKEYRLLKESLTKFSSLNARQRELIRHAIKHPTSVFTVEEHRVSHGVTYETARTDLLDLVDKRLLKKTTMGRKMLFHLSDQHLAHSPLGRRLKDNA